MNTSKAIHYAQAHNIKPNKFFRMVQQREAGASLRGSLVALMSEIHNATGYRNELAAMRRRERLLDHTTRKDNGKEFKGYANERDMKKHSRTGEYYDKNMIYEIYEVGNMRGSESLVAPDSFESCALQGMDKAETVSRNIADNQ